MINPFFLFSKISFSFLLRSVFFTFLFLILLLWLQEKKRESLSIAFESEHSHPKEEIIPLSSAEEETYLPIIQIAQNPQSSEDSLSSETKDSPNEETTLQKNFFIITSPQGKSIPENDHLSLEKNLSFSAFSSHFNNLITVFDFLLKEPRGKVKNNKIFLSSELSGGELIKVFLHELAHIIDVQGLRPGLFGDDLSQKFYEISWENTHLQKKGSKTQDFVSGYAASNKYEDFAESFVFYVFHNEEFLFLSKKNLSLEKKYQFFADHIFGKDWFQGISFEKEALGDYLWDTTKIPISVEKYLHYIK